MKVKQYHGFSEPTFVDLPSSYKDSDCLDLIVDLSNGEQFVISVRGYEIGIHRPYNRKTGKKSKSITINYDLELEY